MTSEPGQDGVALWICSLPCLSQVTLETTIGNKNAALWKYVQPQGCVLEWIRNIVANRLAVDGATWAEVFKRFNSGTCVCFWPHTPTWRPSGLWGLLPSPFLQMLTGATQALFLFSIWVNWGSRMKEFSSILSCKRFRLKAVPSLCLAGIITNG